MITCRQMKNEEFVLYETWSFLEFLKNGQCRFAGGTQESDSTSPEMQQRKSLTGGIVRQVCDYRKAHGTRLP